jgi:serine/threonine protein kinase
VVAQTDTLFDPNHGQIDELDEVIGSAYIELGETEDPSGVLADFQEALNNSFETTPVVINFDTIFDTVESDPAVGKTITVDCLERVNRSSESAAQFSRTRWFVGSDELAAELTGIQALRVSRTSIGETSAHGVFFGVIEGPSRKIRVAIKPFRSQADKPKCEWVNTNLATKNGLSTFRVLGFIFGNDASYMVTERQDGVESMDNANWSVALANPEANQAMLDDLRKIGPMVARLHEKGIFHGDLQMKNCVVTERGDVHCIDWESTIFVSPEAVYDESDLNHELTGNKAIHDLVALFASLARTTEFQGVGLLSSLTPAAQLSYFSEMVLTPYLETRLDLALNKELSSDTSETVQAVLTKIQEHIEDYIMSEKLKDSMARLRINLQNKRK